MSVRACVLDAAGCPSMVGHPGQLLYIVWGGSSSIIVSLIINMAGAPAAVAGLPRITQLQQILLEQQQQNDLLLTVQLRARRGEDGDAIG